ncbi:MAG: cobyrinate a,c-diamide synthase [Eubacteriales bacterium]|nr:cobyrinate a,c-diamide synthase [Eubacteriales bacterium]
MKNPRIMLAAGASGSGKTLITCGLLQVLVNRGLKVSSFKCGPDYIDPMFHSKVIGTKSRNLDTFFTGSEMTRWLFARNAADCDISVMEGVMGYYDGVAGVTTKASAYDLAQTTDTPVILIVNSKGMSLSLAAYIKGFLSYRENSHIKGVIFNQMSPMLYPRMKEAVEKELSVSVLGYVPKVEDCVIESRHLGLMLPEEIVGLKERLQKLAGILENKLDIDGILALADSAPDMDHLTDPRELNPDYSYHAGTSLRIGVSSDEAFCFFYEDNFELLREMGATLVPFSPLHDTKLPENLDGLLLYGGYPELYCRQLSENSSMREDIRKFLNLGMPCMAECGGFMYLHEQMEDMEGHFYPQVGVLPGNVFRTPKLSRFGYITLDSKENVSAFCADNLKGIPAHEFHYFDSENCGTDFSAKKPESRRGWECLHAEERRLLGFPHFYYYGQPALPAAFLKACETYKGERHS